MMSDLKSAEIDAAQTAIELQDHEWVGRSLASSRVKYVRGLETRSGRMKIKPGPKAYWRTVSGATTTLGYQRRHSGSEGRWIARNYIGAGKYRQVPLGKADDYTDADDDTVLNFAQAQARVRAGAPGIDLQTNIINKWLWFANRHVEPKCFLYRHYDAQGDLLYVGMTLFIQARQKDHLKKAEWANSIFQIIIEPFASREELIEAEQHAIRTEYPKYNKTHNDRSLRRALTKKDTSS